jgi:hypothetical protein
MVDISAGAEDRVYELIVAASAPKTNSRHYGHPPA